MILPKRLLLIGAAPFAVAALYGGSVAFAQSGEPTPSTTPQQTSPAPADPSTPGTPKGPHDSANCPNMGGSGGSSDSSQGSGMSTQTRFHSRGAHSSSVAY